MNKVTLDLIMDYYGKVATNAYILDYKRQNPDVSQLIQVKNLLIRQLKELKPTEIRTIYDERHLANSIRINQIDGFETVGRRGVEYLTAERRADMNLLQILDSVRYGMEDISGIVKFFQEERNLVEFIDIYSDFFANATLRHLNSTQKVQVSKVKGIADYFFMVKLANMTQEEMLDFLQTTSNYRNVFKREELEHRHQMAIIDECFGSLSSPTADVIEHNIRSLQRFYHQQNVEKLTNEKFGVVAMMDKVHNFCYSNLNVNSNTVEGM